jgi:hypothetical protein
MEILDEQKKWVKSLRNFWHIIGRYNYMKWLEHHKGTIEEIITNLWNNNNVNLLISFGNIFNMLMRGIYFSTKIFLVMDNKKKQRKSLCRFEDDMVHVYYYIHILVSIHSLVLNSRILLHPHPRIYSFTRSQFMYIITSTSSYLFIHLFSILLPLLAIFCCIQFLL